ncbi:recombinase family protein [Magnetospirillum sp. UT-4]|uniref:recombinase family protein n=1 Tax=Magnetospirillum sp. UT-4 TaxID=2681467 RepID=UPI0013819EB5|nr:recombinase family protein [Magnetospirillum sp. UT-4]CAA7621083.1 Site-specific DNA recombinase [Magnetospirillum sp. UT-4]
MRFAIYARYSDDNQSEHSIDDQVRLCRAKIAEMGGEVAEVYPEYAISGGALITRPTCMRLLEDAKSGRFDAVMAEALDRVSRNQADTATIYQRLEFLGVKLFTSEEGEINELHIGLKGTMNALFLKQLAAKVKRGQIGRAEAGLAQAGLAYGYRLKREFDARGEVIKGLREIHPEQGPVVFEIFDRFARGESPRAIAADLNRRGIPAPSGGEWFASTINGNRQRQTGFLYNELYTGRMVFNRSSKFKDPETGKYQIRMNPPDKWVVKEMPELRIIPDALWERVQRLKQQNKHYPTHRLRRPKHILSGLVRCGCCGASYTVNNRDRMACTRRKEAGAEACSNGHTIRIADLEQRVLDGITAKLLAPEVLAEYLKTYHEERKRLQVESGRRQADLKKRLPALEKEIANLADAIAEHGYSKVLGDRLAKLERERDDVTAKLATIEEEDNVVLLHPRAVDAYKKAVGELSRLMEGDDQARREAMAVLRPMIQSIDVLPGERRGETKIMMNGILARFLAFGTEPDRQKHYSVGAGEGIRTLDPNLGKHGICTYASSTRIR